MSRVAVAPRVVVEAPARLHFGVLDLRGALGRRFGGLGAAVPFLRVRLEARPHPVLEATGPESGRALEFARRFLAHHRVEAGALLTVQETVPAHAGLGSGTQLGLAVGRALAELFGLPTDAPGLAAAVGRGARSGVGTWLFALGGFVLEGGRRDGRDAVAPLLGRWEIPTAWRAVVAIPDAAPGLSGEREASAFRALPLPPEAEVERVSHRVLLGLLPALVEGDLAGFGAALTEVQEITGGWFAASQGGRFAPGPTAELVSALRLAGAAGVGQSSWGPTVYAIASGDDEARRLAAIASARLGVSGRVYTGPFAGAGARVIRCST